MIVFEEELRYLPRHRQEDGSSPATVYLWQHFRSVSQLRDLACIHFPLLQLSAYEGLADKRFVERISVDMLACTLCGPTARLLHSANGRPYLQQGEWEISVSHTAHTYALSLSRHAHGMDIEAWGNRALRIAGRFLHPAELDLLHNLPPYTPEQAATLLWSSKEAAFKRFSAHGAQVISEVHLTAIAPHRLLATLPALQLQAQVVCVPYPHCVCTYCI